MILMLSVFLVRIFTPQKIAITLTKKRRQLYSMLQSKTPASILTSLLISATRVHSGPADELQPFPSLHLPTTQSAFDRIICFSSAVHVFVLCQLQKTHFPFFSPSFFPCLLLASPCGVGGERECGFNQRAGQPPPLMIHSTSRLSEEWGRGRCWNRALRDFSCSLRKKPRQYDSRQCRLSMQADLLCCHMQEWTATAHYTKQGRERRIGRGREW